MRHASAAEWCGARSQVPDAVSQYFLSLSGYHSTDPRVTRIASLAAHKFVADLNTGTKKQPKEARLP